MPSEEDLRDLFAASRIARPIVHRIDSGKVIASSRARRLPKRLAVGAIGTLAVAGIVAVSLPALLPQRSAISTRSEGVAAPSAEAFDTITRAPADRRGLCAGVVTDPVPSLSGLRLDLEFPATAPIGTDPVQGVVRLTNTGTETVTGTTAASPAVTLSQDGIVLWHSNGPTTDLGVAVELAPGQSIQYPASFTPVRCDVQDEETGSFRADLPAVSAGRYDLSAAIDFVPAASIQQQEGQQQPAQQQQLDLVTGPLSPIALE